MIVRVSERREEAQERERNNRGDWLEDHHKKEKKGNLWSRRGGILEVAVRLQHWG